MGESYQGTNLVWFKRDFWIKMSYNQIDCFREWAIHWGNVQVYILSSVRDIMEKIGRWILLLDSLPNLSFYESEFYFLLTWRGTGFLISHGRRKTFLVFLNSLFIGSCLVQILNCSVSSGSIVCTISSMFQSNFQNLFEIFHGNW